MASWTHKPRQARGDHISQAVCPQGDNASRGRNTGSDSNQPAGERQLEIFLLVIASILLLASGWGIVLLLLPRSGTVGIEEVVALSVLLGAGFVSLGLFFLGFLVHGPALQALLSVVCVLLAVAGSRRVGNQGIQIRPLAVTSAAAGTLVLLAATVGLVTWFTFRQSLGWDGLFIWEFKARLAATSGGSIPQAYYQDPARSWSHPDYPLLLPLSEAWFYIWLGRPHQHLVKILFPLFYVAMIGLLVRGAPAFGGCRRQGVIAAALVFAVPSVVLGEGASSGYADFPLGVFYLATVLYAAEYVRTGERDYLPVIGALAACLLWVKQEGMILAPCVFLAALPRILRDGGWKSLVTLVLPGWLLVVCWEVYLRNAGVQRGLNFMEVTPANVWNHLDRIPDVANWMAKEVLNWNAWGILWPAFLLALVLPDSKTRGSARLLLAFVILVPLIAYMGSYVLSSWDPFLDHVKYSLPRLMLHVTPLAVLFVATSLPHRLMRCIHV